MRRPTDKAAAAIQLAELGIAVTPGPSVTREGACRCGSSTCGVPGRHPIDPVWLLHATTDARTVRQLWQQWPDANIVTPLLGPFHVVETAAAIGRLVRAWIGDHADLTGPVAVTPQGRYLFWTVPGVAVELGVLLDRRGYSPPEADLRVHTEGSYVLAPPSATGALAPYRWHLPPRTHVRDMPCADTLVQLLLEACRQVDTPVPQPTA